MAQRLRLLTGLVLFTYVGTHLLNHALGVFSLQAAEAGRWWFLAFWRNPLVSIVLYGSLLTHITLALVAIYRRRHFRLPAWEIVRLILGLTIPLLLVTHVAANRVNHELYGLNDNYARVITTFWVLNPPRGLQQAVLLIVAWTHGCLGVWFWLRTKPWFARLQPVLLLLAVLPPLLALLGYVDMGLQVREQAAVDPEWVRRSVPPLPPGAAATQQALVDGALAVFVGAVAATFLARWLRTLRQRRDATITIGYPDGQRVAIAPGTTILEASRAARIPHAALCGGRGRCSTCRVRVGAGLDTLPAPSSTEARVLRRVGAPPNVRLACQTRPTADLDVFPLLPPGRGLVARSDRAGREAGAERELAILFADMRAFTRLAERRLPYDVVFLLNQWADTLGQAVERAGGQPNQFTGDGIMALFGLESDVAAGCRDALRAAVEMARALERLNDVLAADLAEPLRIGIGVHTGPVIVGEMGYGLARYLTAIGDAVNTASRLEALTKGHQAQLVVSEQVATRAGVDLSTFPADEVQVRGRTSPLEIRVVANALDLAPLLADATPVAAATPAQELRG